MYPKYLTLKDYRLPKGTSMNTQTLIHTVCKFSFRAEQVKTAANILMRYFSLEFYYPNSQKGKFDPTTAVLVSSLTNAWCYVTYLNYIDKSSGYYIFKRYKISTVFVFYICFPELPDNFSFKNMSCCFK